MPAPIHCRQALIRLQRQCTAAQCKKAQEKMCCLTQHMLPARLSDMVYLSGGAHARGYQKSCEGKLPVQGGRNCSQHPCMPLDSCQAAACFSHLAATAPHNHGCLRFVEIQISNPSPTWLGNRMCARLTERGAGMGGSPNTACHVTCK